LERRPELDGKPARLTIAQPAPPAAGQPDAAPAPAEPPPGGPLVVLYVSGKGRHTLNLAVRMRLSRQGGWRIVEGVLPAAPATSLAITVPQAQTEVRLGQVIDRRSWEVEKAGEKIETALGSEGVLDIQWRPKVAEGQVDRSLTAQSVALLDVQEDGLRLIWRLGLEFRRSQREHFTVTVPEKYLVEKLEGGNVRGWEVRPAQGKQQVEVTLLKPARDHEEFTLHLWRGGAVGQKDFDQFEAPVVSVLEAALSNGELAIRVSPLLDLRVLSAPEQAGLRRVELSDESRQLAADSGKDQSPLGIQPYQAYRFVRVPFSLRLGARPVGAALSAKVQTILKISEYQRHLESTVSFTVQGRPIHRVEIRLPEDLKIEHVSAPGKYQWAVSRQDKRPLLTIYLTAGQQGDFVVLIAGTLGATGALKEFPATLPLPRLEIPGAQEQQTEIAVQADPALDVQAQKLGNGCQQVALSRVFGWLRPEQHRVTRLALHCGRADYTGQLRLALRQPEVTCDTITNVRLTDRTVEETILLDFTIAGAGIRQLSFRLPASMSGCRISAPRLRQKDVQDKPGEPVRVRLEFQEEVMEQLRVLVENDRLLKRRRQYTAPIPVVEQWSTNRQYVTLELAPLKSGGRDEVVIGPLAGLEPLGRNQKEWETVKGKLDLDISEAYVLTGAPEKAQLAFQTEEHEAVQTAGARIGLAETVLVLDANGAYRAEQRYKIANTTEQVLELELPPGAALWTARVAGEPVKPIRDPNAAADGPISIPLVKTAPGSLDYEVVLRYGGKMPPLAELGTLGFPLIHARNVEPAQSQVTLYVPKTHRWLHFGGTMRQVGDEGGLAAGYLAYQTRQIERLKETAQQGNVYDKLRAQSSLKGVKWQMEQMEQMEANLWTERYSRSPSLRSEFSTNAAALQQAEQAVQQAEQSAAQAQTQDNRGRLNDLFAGHKTSRSKNVVQDVGVNWSDAMVQPRKPTAPQAGNVQFNDKWLDQSKLLSPTQRQGGSPDATKGPIEGQRGEQPVLWETKPSADASRQPKGQAAAERSKPQWALEPSRPEVTAEDRRTGRDRFAWLRGRHCSTLLIVLGLVALVCGIFWVLALAAIIAGITIKVRRAIERRAALKAPIAG